MLGGIQAFGLIGIIVGPLIMALFISLINVIKDFEDERECAGAPGLQAPHDPVSGEVRG